MSFVTRAKKEYENYKTAKKLENDPEVMRYKLQKAREEKRQEQLRMQEKLQYERDKQELKELQQKNSKFGGFLKNTQSYLQDVKQRQQVNTKKNASLGTGNNIIYDQTPKNAFEMDKLGKESVKKKLLSNEKSKKGVFAR